MRQSVIGTVIAVVAVALAFALFSLPSQTVYADGEVVIDETNFPDATFRNYIKNTKDSNGDGVLSVSEISCVESINLNHINRMGRESGALVKLDGIEFFTNLKTLEFDNNKVKEIDVSKNAKLECLSCVNNRIEKLDLSKNSSLKTLKCGDNSINSLDLSKNTVLDHLECNSNPIKALDLTSNKELTYLYCSNNDIRKIDVSANTKLEHLVCNDCHNLTTVVANKGIKEMYCSGCSLTSLDVSKYTDLEHLGCGDNKLKELDLSKNTKLLELTCTKNELKTLDLSKNNLLKKLDISSGSMQSIDISKCKDLEYLDCNWSDLESLDLSGNPKLSRLDCTYTKVKVLNIWNNSLLIKTFKEGEGSETSNCQYYKLDVNGNKYELACNLSAKIVMDKPTPTPQVSLKLDKSTASVKCGDSLTLKATVTGSSSKVSWKSSDTGIAAVDSAGKITAKQAGTVTITATVAGKSASCVVTVLYKDVTNSKDFWYAPTNYLTAAGVVKGYDKQTKFKPANDCTRAQMVTFLYRLQGEPKVKSTTCKFTDVKKSDYFFKPVIWAVEKGITTGVSKTKFNPQGVCTRAQTVTFLWRMADKPQPKTTENKFKDVKAKDYFYQAVLWASEKKIVAGYNDNTFRPQGKCLRRQMVTFLYKYDKFINGKG